MGRRMIKPFRGLRPPAELAQQLACPPYDVVSSAEARAFANDNPLSFFHISRPEVGLPESVDEHAPEVYAKGREQLGVFLRNGWLKPDAAASFYVYRQRMGGHVQVGLVTVASVE